MSKSLNDHHNDGQTDRAEGNGYNAPHGLLEDVLTWSSDGCQRITEDNEAYRQGWENADKQDK